MGLKIVEFYDGTYGLQKITFWSKIFRQKKFMDLVTNGYYWESTDMYFIHCKTKDLDEAKRILEYNKSPVKRYV